MVYHMLMVLFVSGLMTNIVECAVTYSTTSASDLEKKLFNLEDTPADTYAWLGGDSDVSVVLSEDTTLWLFADTIMTEYDAKTKSRSAKDWNMPHNTIGFTHDGNAGMTFYWQMDEAGLATSFFAPSENPDTTLYWPIAGFPCTGQKDTTGTCVYILAYYVNLNSTDALGFSIMGTTGITVNNVLEESPLNWDYTTSDFPHGDKFQFISISSVDSSSEVYLCGITTEEIQQNFIAQADLSDLLAGVYDNMQYYAEYPDTTGPKWYPYASDFTLVSLFSGNFSTTELTLTHNDYLKQWYTINVNGFAGTSISIRVADTPTGPYTEHVIYTIPPPLNDTSTYFCYAAKAHPELNANLQEIIFTYICNTFDVDTLFAQNQIIAYTPNIMRVTIGNQYQLSSWFLSFFY